MVMSSFVFLIVTAPGVGLTRPIETPLRSSEQLAPGGFVLMVISWLVPSKMAAQPAERDQRRAQPNIGFHDSPPRVIPYDITIAERPNGVPQDRREARAIPHCTRAYSICEQKACVPLRIEAIAQSFATVLRRDIAPRQWDTRQRRISPGNVSKCKQARLLRGR